MNAKLIEREWAILEEIIQYYSRHREAVSARTLSRQSRLALAPTTIRNLMENLGEYGFLSASGVTRGRVPTPQAYALYVERLCFRPASQEASAAGAQQGAAEADPVAAHEEEPSALLEPWLETNGQALSEATGYLAFLLEPQIDKMPLDWVRFLPVERDQLVVVLHTQLGLLQSKLLSVSEAYPAELLQRMEEFLRTHHRGQTLERVRREIMSGGPQELLEEMPSLGAAFRMLRRAFEWSQTPLLRSWGRERLYELPECAKVDVLIPLERICTSPGSLQEILKRAFPVHGLLAAMGETIGTGGLAAFSLLCAPFGWGEWRGWWGVIGPMWMDYERMIPLLLDRTAHLDAGLAQRVAAMDAH